MRRQDWVRSWYVLSSKVAIAARKMTWHCIFATLAVCVLNCAHNMLHLRHEHRQILVWHFSHLPSKHHWGNSAACARLLLNDDDKQTMGLPNRHWVHAMQVTSQQKLSNIQSALLGMQGPSWSCVSNLHLATKVFLTMCNWSSVAMPAGTCTWREQRLRAEMRTIATLQQPPGMTR